jgi:hypothetical protein
LFHRKTCRKFDVIVIIRKQIDVHSLLGSHYQGRKRYRNSCFNIHYQRRNAKIFQQLLPGKIQIDIHTTDSLVIIRQETNKNIAVRVLINRRKDRQMVQESLIGESILTNAHRLIANVPDHARSAVLTEMLLETNVFCDITSYWLGNICRCLEKS